MNKKSLREQINELTELGFFGLSSEFEPVYSCIYHNADRILIQQVNRELYTPVYQCKRNYTTHINERVNTAINE